ncbi:hypothetical protein SAMN05661010_02971 [Modicisalibacter muralis]|uniref:Uncharacterized protein n=1 Tax=Modicisalibacter muralis TaxID=119000 RepID=A0A1G9P9R1_9GAMM|nr:hypothetical protein [Halomonas muralis]SDL95518.1 hypothetical protein SAMN05661010_02971 [Halomonas muralis]
MRPSRLLSTAVLGLVLGASLMSSPAFAQRGSYDKIMHEYFTYDVKI